MVECAREEVTSAAEAHQLLDDAEMIFTEVEVNAVVEKMAQNISSVLNETDPLVLSVMGGAVVFSGWLLPKLLFPLDFDYVQASRYRNQIQGHDIHWRVPPSDNVRGRTVLLVDDILDEGITLAAVRDKCLESGAARVMIAVLTEKTTGRPKPIKADFVGLIVPDRYVFGCGMDVRGRWRNLPAIYALK
ncbi:MAG: hypoxanthine-guanine phosphoribosyltransferase [Betaproteobacteria bacterium]|nr:hypoxanthine-guanine phosphoribosyltransferase [Betaproteobacteria bacterium]